MQHAGIGYELVLALDAPVMQMVEEVYNYGFLHAPLVLREQMIVQEIPVPSSLGRATQPIDVEQVLNVPVLHMNDEDILLSKFQEQVTTHEIPQVQVPSLGASFVQEQVIVQSLPEVQVHVPRQRVPQRHVEQVVDVHVPPVTVSDSIMEQVVDVPVADSSGHDLRQSVQQSTGSSAAALDLAEEQMNGFFELFPEKKVRRSLRSRLRNWCRTRARPRPQPMVQIFDGDDDVWVRFESAHARSGRSCARIAPSGTRRRER